MACEFKDTVPPLPWIIALQVPVAYELPVVESLHTELLVDGFCVKSFIVQLPLPALPATPPPVPLWNVIDKIVEPSGIEEVSYPMIALVSAPAKYPILGWVADICTNPPLLTYPCSVVNSGKETVTEDPKTNSSTDALVVSTENVTSLIPNSLVSVGEPFSFTHPPMEKGAVPLGRFVLEYDKSGLLIESPITPDVVVPVPEIEIKLVEESVSVPPWINNSFEVNVICESEPELFGKSTWENSLFVLNTL